MNLTRCSNGHFYDASTFQHCPHCDAAPSGPSNPEMTQALNPNPELTERISGDLASAVGNAMGNTPSAAPASVAALSRKIDDEPKTIGIYKKKGYDLEPVVGWLVSVEGAHKGKDFRLKAGRNFIGRSNSMDVPVIDDQTVSRDRHAIVVYEPNNHLFIVQPGDAKELCYLNGEVVLTPQTLKLNDVLTVGATKLMFFPCCDGNFNWDMTKDKA